MAFESSSRRKLAKLVSDHVLSNVNRNELVPIMNCHCMADEFIARILFSRASWMYGPFLNERLIILISV